MGFCKILRDNLVITSILVLFLDIASTYYCSGESLKYEVNPLYLKYKFGWGLLITILTLFCILDIFLHLYTKHYYIKQLETLNKNKVLSNFIKKKSLHLHFGHYFKIINLIIIFIGFYRIRIYIISHIIIVINNFLLGIIYNNSHLKIDEVAKHTTIYTNTNWVWSTFLGDLAIAYFSMGHNKNQALIDTFNLTGSLMIISYFIYKYLPINSIIDKYRNKLF